MLFRFLLNTFYWTQTKSNLIKTTCKAILSGFLKCFTAFCYYSVSINLISFISPSRGKKIILELQSNPMFPSKSLGLYGFSEPLQMNYTWKEKVYKFFSYPSSIVHYREGILDALRARGPRHQTDYDQFTHNLFIFYIKKIQRRIEFYIKTRKAPPNHNR